MKRPEQGEVDVAAYSVLLPLPPAGLRRNHEAHWRSRKGLKDRYSAEVYAEAVKQASGPSARLQGPLRAVVEGRQVGRGDCDNALSGAKVVLDCLGAAPKTMAGADRYYCGWYESDEQIEEITVRRVRVHTKAAEGVKLIIWSVLT